VQAAACCAVAILAEEAGSALAPLLEPILQQLVAAVGMVRTAWPCPHEHALMFAECADARGGTFMPVHFCLRSTNGRTCGMCMTRWRRWPAALTRR
jgi:hypothetical protein